MQLDKENNGFIANISQLKKGAIVVGVVSAASLLTWGITHNKEIDGSTVDTSENEVGFKPDKERRLSVPGWTYEEKLERRGEGKVFIARTDSVTKIRQGWPYDSETYLSIILSGYEGRGSGVAIELSSGEFDCPLIECFMSFGFDGQAPTKYRLLGANSGDESIKFLSLPREYFINEIKKSSSVEVITELVGYGNAKFKFDTEGLAWVY